MIQKKLVIASVSHFYLASDGQWTGGLGMDVIHTKKSRNLLSSIQTVDKTLHIRLNIMLN